MRKTMIVENDGFIRLLLDTATVMSADRYGVQLLLLRVGDQRWYVEASREEGTWKILSVTS